MNSIKFTHFRILIAAEQKEAGDFIVLGLGTAVY